MFGFTSARRFGWPPTRRARTVAENGRLGAPVLTPSRPSRCTDPTVESIALVYDDTGERVPADRGAVAA